MRFLKKNLPSWLVILLITSIGIAIVYIVITLSTPEPLPGAFDFTISVNPESGSTQQGESVQTTVNVTLLSGTPQMVTLSASGLSSGASAVFNVSSGNPTFTAALTISAAASTPTGNQTITLTGTGGGLTKTANYTLTVTPTSQPFDFSLSVSPDSGSVQQGNSIAQPITVSLTSGSPELVGLSASGLPSGTSASFSQSSGDPTFTSTMTISTSPTTPTGTYTIMVNASGGGLTKTTTYTLTVTSPPSSYTVTFTQTGLPSGTTWSVTFEGTEKSSTASSIMFTVGPGTYNWNVSSPIPSGSGVRYVASPASESTDVSLQTSQSITYTPEYELMISASPSEAGVTDPASGSYWYSAGSKVPVSASPSAPFTVSLSASGLPEGASGNFRPSSNTPTFTSTLTVTIGESTALDTYTVTVSGTKSGYRLATWMLDENEAGSANSITVNMSAPHVLLAEFTQPSVRISLDPSSIDVPQGGSSSLTVAAEEAGPERLSASFTLTSVVPYVIRVYARDVEDFAVVGVSVALGGQTKTTNSYGYADFYVAAGPHNITVPSQATIWHQSGSVPTTHADLCPFDRWDDGPESTRRTITVSEDATYTARYKLVLHFAGSLTYGSELMAWPPGQIHYFFAGTTSFGSEGAKGYVESTRGTRISEATVTAYFDITTVLERFTRSGTVTTDNNGSWSIDLYAYDAITRMNRVRATASKDGYVSASWSST